MQGISKMQSKIDLYKGDCLEVMDEFIARGVAVDAIICDPPYGTTACKWDSVIDFDEMWLRLNKLIKPNGAIVLFGSEPFSSVLRMSNIKNYKYDWKWNKSKVTGFLNAKKQPLRKVEDIIVFYKKQCNYNPQMKKVKERFVKRSGGYSRDGIGYGNHESVNSSNNGLEYPFNVIEIKSNGKSVHPTQKPVALMEYLIKTYTNEGELVLDFTAGSFTTGVACQNTNRDFIGIEMDDKYFKIGSDRMAENKKRIEDTVVEKELINESK